MRPTRKGKYTMSSLFELTQIKANLLRSAEQTLTTKGAKSPEYLEQKRKLDETQETIDLLSTAERGLKGSSAPIVAAPAIIAETSEARRAKVISAARSFFRHGVNGLKPEERAILTTSDTVGGALNAQYFNDVFNESARYFGPVWGMVNRKDQMTGNPAKFPVTSDVERTFSLLIEGTTSALSVNQTPSVFSDVINTDTILSSVQYSRQEAEDAEDLEAWLNRMAGVAVSHAWETAVTLSISNDGTATALPSSPTGGLLASVSAGLVQASGTLAAGITTANLQALAGSVDRAYYVNGSFMASPSVETFLRSQVDTTGKQLYKIDPATGYLIIAGRPLVPNTAMPNAGTASSPLVLFGDYSKAWNVLNAGLRLKVIANENSPTLAYNTRELIMWSRLGQSAGVVGSVKSLVSAAS
jgi:HK97 family phage major capsid protein